MKKIIKNAIRCNRCGETIESSECHEYVTCKCGRCSVDGGTDYLRRSFTDSINDYTELSVVENIPDNNA